MTARCKGTLTLGNAQGNARQQPAPLATWSCCCCFKFSASSCQISWTGNAHSRIAKPAGRAQVNKSPAGPKAATNQPGCPVSNLGALHAWPQQIPPTHFTLTVATYAQGHTRTRSNNSATHVMPPGASSAHQTQLPVRGGLKRALVTITYAWAQ